MKKATVTLIFLVIIFLQSCVLSSKAVTATRPADALPKEPLPKFEEISIISKRVDSWERDLRISDISYKIVLFPGESLIDVMEDLGWYQEDFVVTSGESVVVYVDSGYDFFFNHLVEGGRKAPYGLKAFIPGQEYTFFQSAFLTDGTIVFNGGHRSDGTPFIEVSVRGGRTLVEGSSIDGGYNWVFKSGDQNFTSLSDAVKHSLKDFGIQIPNYIW